MTVASLAADHARASEYPSISAVNPALTAMANAIRVGDHLLERLG
jgi:choline dehydrogenase-like flavoprotein